MQRFRVLFQFVGKVKEHVLFRGFISAEHATLVNSESGLTFLIYLKTCREYSCMIIIFLYLSLRISSQPFFELQKTVI